MRARTIAVMALFLAVAFAPMALSDGSDAAGFDVTDGLGNDFHFDGPVDKLITVGAGVTATVIGVGALDKIVVCDSYSKSNADPIFDDLRKLVEEGKIAAGGNIYSSGKEQLKTDIIDAADPETGSFDRTKDAVIVTGSDTYRANIVPVLEENGFEVILQWYDITEYEDIIGFAETISMVSTGSVHESVEQMEETTTLIDATLERADVDVAKAFYITYSGGTFKVGNDGSLTNSMIIAAGGDSVTDGVDGEKTYPARPTEIVEQNPGVVVFVDNTIAKNAEYLSELRKAVGDDTRLVILDPMWNNYSIKSVEGVWTMACAMYPELFSGDVPEASSEESNVLVYVGAAVAAMAVIAVVAYLLMRKGH